MGIRRGGQKCGHDRKSRICRLNALTHPSAMHNQGRTSLSKYV